MDGILPIWKPAGITSFDVIRIFRRKYRGEKIGHAGTLDPFAEGVLILLLGKATRRFDEIQGWDKTYVAMARLGAYSDTLDSTGNLKQYSVNSKQYSAQEIQEIADRFVGEINQEVPQYSAAKYKGKPMYKYARSGENVPPKYKSVTVYSIKVDTVSDEEVTMTVSCSSGTYIRQLSYDIFNKIGIQSYLKTLIRTKIGDIEESKCMTIEQIENGDFLQLL